MLEVPTDTRAQPANTFQFKSNDISKIVSNSFISATWIMSGESVMNEPEENMVAKDEVE